MTGSEFLLHDQCGPSSHDGVCVRFKERREGNIAVQIHHGAYSTAQKQQPGVFKAQIK
jgi:hypothetical protein